MVSSADFLFQQPLSISVPGTASPASVPASLEAVPIFRPAIVG
jgi:hypothetical protein